MRKKTRARVHVPVSRRIKRQLRFHRDLEKNARDPILRKHWDNKKTIRQNIASLSLEQLSTRLAEDYTPSNVR